LSMLKSGDFTLSGPYCAALQRNTSGKSSANCYNFALSTINETLAAVNSMDLINSIKHFVHKYYPVARQFVHKSYLAAARFIGKYYPVVARFIHNYTRIAARLIHNYARIAARFIHKYYLVTRHYPRDHLFIAGAMGSLVLILVILPAGEEQAGNPAQTQIPIAITLADTKLADTELDQAVTLSDFVVSTVDSAVVSTVVSTKDTAPNPVPASNPVWRNIEVESGDSLSAIFTKVGLSNQDLFRVLNSSDEAKVLNRLYPGYQLDFKIPGEGELEQLRVLKSPLEGYLFTLNENHYDVESIVNIPEVAQTFKVGTIADSLFMAGQREKIPTITIMEMANIFGGVLDFILDPRSGDDFSILYEEKYLHGAFIDNGEILATQYTNQGKTFTAIRYVDEQGETGYYNTDGESMRKAFLRSPLDVSRITSNFSLSRRHPILNTIRAHKGTDYAANRGTPIRATSDGQVTRASRYGSFGNLIIIKHDGGFETKYAHLSKYANGIKKGSRVRQGDIIGYVGSTGGATGPHLHYEFLVGGVHQDPRTILDKLPKAKSIAAAELDRFKTQTGPLLQQFVELNGSRLLSSHQPSAD
jgi:murein DD-endopeptidase MepM/ murein hydrolase activator NlpD